MANSDIVLCNVLAPTRNAVDSSMHGSQGRIYGARGLGHLCFGAPSICDLFGHLSEKRESMHLLCIVPTSKIYLLFWRLWFYIRCSI